MDVLIVGGTRFLGLNITRRLAERGDNVTVANRGQTSWERPEGVEQIVADVSQEGSLATALRGRTFDVAIHMIAMSASSAAAVLEPLSGKIGHCVQCGSVGVYAPLHYLPADENHPTQPREIGPDNQYVGFSHKLAADAEAARLCEQAAIPLTVLRPTAIVGPGAVPIDIWGDRKPERFQAMLDGEVVQVPNDGRALIHFGHVADLADAFVLALDQPHKPGIYNISSEYAITLNYYLQLLGDALGRTPSIEYVPMTELLRRHPDRAELNERGLRFICEHMCCSIEKAKRVLGYGPERTPERAVEESVRWMMDSGLIGRNVGK